ncbi:MAG: hypothetical protein PQJ59_00035 [Spirochaetales bacterium]|nr:hypothetical protein [Spirochaetales bacterium]
MKVSAKTAAVILPLFFIIGIVGTMASGYWKTESSKDPAKYNTGQFAGESNPADIRGSYSFGNVEEVFGIPAETTAKAFGMSDSDYPAALQAKLFEEVYGFIGDWEIGTDSLRLFVARYKGLPYEPEETTGLPQPAWNILKKEGALTEAELAELEGRLVSLDGIEVNLEEAIAAEEEHEETVVTDTTIKGKTTFGDLYTWGLTEAQVSEALGGVEPGPRTMPVRDYCGEIDLEFSVLKEALQPILDSM